MSTPERKMERRINVRDLRPPDIIVTFPDDRPGKNPEVDEVEYRIRGNLPVDDMIDLVEAEQRVREAMGGPDALAAVQNAERQVRRIIHEHHGEDVWIPRMGLQEAAGLVAYLAAGGTEGLTAEEAVEQALLAGFVPAQADAGAAVAAEAARPVGSGEPEQAPLAPLSSSPAPSSTSDASTAGTSDGGQTEGPAGESSASTSRTATAV